MLQIHFFHPALRSSILRWREVRGFTLVEMIGVVAILAILIGVLAPNVIGRIKSANQDAENQNLQAIAKGVNLYLQQNGAFPPNLSVLSPDNIQLPPAQLTANTNGYTRYYFLQPNLSGFSNATGLSSTQIADARFLLISNLSQNESPTITNDAEFETWWGTDETPTPDLKIHRGHVADLFHLLSLRAEGAGGSFSIDGTVTNSGGGTLSSHVQYHLSGTRIGLDEADPYATPEILFILTDEVAYQFDTDCVAGSSQWRVITKVCYSP
ncbi:MAG: type II secretion system GspH family protein [Nitrospirota bacterium]|nr:type II secretion system GspH family protein [Nitrospirota bacterium]